MNNPQFLSFARWLLNTVSGGIIAYTAAKSPATQTFGAYVANLCTGPDVVSAVVLGLTWLWGHLTHSQPATTSTSAAGSKIPALFILGALGATLAFSTGCKSTPQQVAYQSVATASVTVETALHAYNVFAAAGKTTPAQNSAVKAAYLKYQAAFAVVCDAGAIYAATGTTNAPAASAALQTAIANANQSIADLENLIKSFGVTF